MVLLNFGGHLEQIKILATSPVAVRRDVLAFQEKEQQRKDFREQKREEAMPKSFAESQKNR